MGARPVVVCAHAQRLVPLCVLCRSLRIACSGFGIVERLAAGIAVAMAIRMFAYSDKTIRVEKLEPEPTRALPQHFAPARPRRWTYSVMIAVLAIVGCATTVRLVQRSERSQQAQEVLRLLGR